MTGFMKARNVYGGQLAVTYQGRLVLARGYGYNLPSLPHPTVTPTSLFRVASLCSTRTGSSPARWAYRCRCRTPTSTVLDQSGATVPAPYGTFNMRLHDANGGWLASAVDLVRWASAFDKAGPVLNSTSLGRVFAVPTDVGVNSDGWYYGLGWAVRPVTTGGTGRNTWHTGRLPGTSSLLVRTYNGMSWAAVFNQRDDASGLSYNEIDPLLWAASRKLTTWPTHNFWSTYFG
jgi:CubicO group peptidase (beta-lactamase class C family)